MIRSAALTFLVAAATLSCSNSATTNVAINSNASKPKAAPIAPQEDGHDAPRISLADAKKHFDDKTAVFIDTHPSTMYDLEHIPGAINIQPNAIKQSLDKIPRGQTIIVYCS